MSKYYYKHDKITDDTVITDGDYKYHWQGKRTFFIPTLDGLREYKLNDIRDLLNRLVEKNNNLVEENTNIKKAIENYIKDYEIYDDFNNNDPRSENHTVKHLSYCDMRKHVNDTVIGVLNHLKESYSCPKCGSSHYFVDVTYKDSNVYEKRECGDCNYNEIIKRPEYTYNENEW